MLLVVSAVKLIAEIALMALVGQWLLGLLAGHKRETNVFYQTLDAVTKPFVKGVRRITPRVVIDRHVPVATCVLLSMVWLLATITKINLCLEVGVQSCQ
jgi:YGGT family